MYRETLTGCFYKNFGIVFRNLPIEAFSNAVISNSFYLNLILMQYGEISKCFAQGFQKAGYTGSITVTQHRNSCHTACLVSKPQSHGVSNPQPTQYPARQDAGKMTQSE